MNNELKKKIDRSFRLTHDLLLHLDEKYLALDLPDLPSNKIVDQYWCIVGARESYIKAIESDGWKGFSCSLAAKAGKQGVLAALENTYQKIIDIDFAIFSETKINLAFNLLEHEVQHHGQLIRFVYGNGLTFPDSWKQRYTV